MSLEGSLEILTTFTTEQRLVTTDGLLLIERKTLTTVTEKDGDNGEPKVAKQSDLVHERRIGDQSFVVREVVEHGKIVNQTEDCLPSRDDLQNFKSLWLKNWDPALTSSFQ